MARLTLLLSVLTALVALLGGFRYVVDMIRGCRRGKHGTTKWLAIGLLCVLSEPTRSLAADINAASCSASDVQTAVTSAADGDRVLIPSGTCAWASQVLVPSSKGITLQGDGESSTIIQGTAGMNATNSLQINTSAGKFTRVTQMQFDANGTSKINVTGMIGVLAVGLDTYRLDHITVVAKGRGIILECDNGQECSGLVDHLTLSVPASETTQGISIYGDDRPEEDTAFSRGFTPGTNKAVYIEDSTFTFTGANDGAFDAYNGARFVFRYNTITNTTIGWHGADSGGLRGVHTFEVYRNTFSSTVSTRMQFHRSGTGYTFDNTYTGSYTTLNLAVYRARPQTFVAKYGQCDSSSAWDGNVGSSPILGWPCLDQTGYTFTNASGGSYTSNPMYAWKNTEDSVEVNPTPSETANYLVVDRDFYQFSSATGTPQTTGVRVGTLANRPAGCTAGVGYWATDQGSWNASGADGVFYKCTATDTWASHYTPYTYPHPLQGASEGASGGGSIVLFISQAWTVVATAAQLMTVLGFAWQYRAPILRGAMACWRYTIEMPTPKEWVWMYRYKRAVARWQKDAPLMLPPPSHMDSHCGAKSPTHERVHPWQ